MRTSSREEWKLCPLCDGQGEINYDSYPVLRHPSHYLYQYTRIEQQGKLSDEDADLVNMLKRVYRFLSEAWMGVP